jgi:hypothetical protein
MEPTNLFICGVWVGAAMMWLVFFVVLRRMFSKTGG